MSKLKQIIRLYCQGTGSKKSHDLTGISRRIIKDYIRRFIALRITLQEVEEMDDLALYELFYPKAQNHVVPDRERWARLQALLPGIVKALRQKGMTLEVQWNRYRQIDPQGYGHTQFYEYIREYRQRSGHTMHLEHKPGEKVFVDFCGDKLGVVDPQSGEMLPVEVFVAILGFSQLTYVEAVFSQRKEDFINCCRHCFEYYGGVPGAIVPDNLKAAVTKSSKYEPLLNETFETFAEHYNTVILPARSYKPRDKALVENAVKLVYQRIYSSLGSSVFTHLDGLNEAIRVEMEKHNAAPLKKEESRRLLFEQDERETLLPLPSLPYELHRIKFCKVMKNGHVSLHEDRHYYSVPYNYIGKKVKMIYNSSRVDLYYQFKLIARHQRNYRRNRYTTLTDHLASKHKFLSEWNPEFFISKAREIHADVAVFIEKLMESKAHPEQGYKACSGILNLARRVGSERIAVACRRALEYNAYTYHIVEDILRKGLDTLLDEDEKAPLAATPRHANLRGKAYYQQYSLTFKNSDHE